MAAGCSLLSSILALGSRSTRIYCSSSSYRLYYSKVPMQWIMRFSTRSIRYACWHPGHRGLLSAQRVRHVALYPNWVTFTFGWLAGPILSTDLLRSSRC